MILSRRFLVSALVFFSIHSIVIGANRKQLEPWLNDELLPFLEDRLGRHPRLKGQPFEVVGTNENNALGKMDGLTADIVRKIVDRLQSVPDANLVKHLPIKPWGDQGKSIYLACDSQAEATVQVIIEVDNSLGSGEVRVAVQAIDLVENNWVRGFKKIWTGQLTSREKRLMSKQIVDRKLLGSRALPFRSNQPDLLASFLAENLSCLLMRTGETNLKIFVRKPTENLPEFLQTAYGLLGHYLARFREIEITKNKHIANVKLTWNIYAIDLKLLQISLLLQSFDTLIRIPGVGTEAYIHSDSVTSQLPTKQRLIASFNLITPRQRNPCQHHDPWIKGFTGLTEASRLPSKGCFALRLKAIDTAKLYLIGQTDDNQLTRLFPDSCDVLSLNHSLSRGAIRKNQSIHAPLWDNGKRGFFQLDQRPGIERIYAIAVSDPATEAKLKLRVGRIGELCSVQKYKRMRQSQGFRAELKVLSDESHGGMEWMERSFIHIP